MTAADEPLTCAPRPCASCPYRKDAPSGLWVAEEYDKLPAYDGEIVEQLMAGAIGVFLCHQRDGHLCAGWAAAHGPRNLLALRLAAAKHEIDPAVFDYETDVPVFASGAEARAHGIADIENPGRKAQRLMDKLLDKGFGRAAEPLTLDAALIEADRASKMGGSVGDMLAAMRALHRPKGDE